MTKHIHVYFLGWIYNRSIIYLYCRIKILHNISHRQVRVYQYLDYLDRFLSGVISFVVVDAVLKRLINGLSLSGPGSNSFLVGTVCFLHYYRNFSTYVLKKKKLRCV